VRFYRAEVLGRLIELRLGEFGGEEVLVDGRPVSRRAFAALMGGSHHFDVTDAAGRVRHVEVDARHESRRLGLGVEVVVNVDGVEFGFLRPVDGSRPPGRCLHCGYDLRGLDEVNGEVRCPECGRHCAASLLR
jgi:hypothetical protein